MSFLLNYQAQGVSGKNEQPAQTAWRGAPRGAGPPEVRGPQRRGAPRGAGPPEARGPMQLRRLHRLKAGPVGYGANQQVYVRYINYGGASHNRSVTG